MSPAMGTGTAGIRAVMGPQWYLLAVPIPISGPVLFPIPVPYPVPVTVLRGEWGHMGLPGGLKAKGAGSCSTRALWIPS